MGESPHKRGMDAEETRQWAHEIAAEDAATRKVAAVHLAMLLGHLLDRGLMTKAEATGLLAEAGRQVLGSTPPAAPSPLPPPALVKDHQDRCEVALRQTHEVLRALLDLRD